MCTHIMPDGYQCGICWDDEDNDPLQLEPCGPCGHAFHKPCLRGWRGHECPICRGPRFVPDEIVARVRVAAPVATPVLVCFHLPFALGMSILGLCVLSACWNMVKIGFTLNAMTEICPIRTGLCPWSPVHLAMPTGPVEMCFLGWHFCCTGACYPAGMSCPVGEDWGYDLCMAFTADSALMNTALYLDDALVNFDVALFLRDLFFPWMSPDYVLYLDIPDSDPLKGILLQHLIEKPSSARISSIMNEPSIIPTDNGLHDPLPRRRINTLHPSCPDPKLTYCCNGPCVAAGQPCALLDPESWSQAWCQAMIDAGTGWPNTQPDAAAAAPRAAGGGLGGQKAAHALPDEPAGHPLP